MMNQTFRNLSRLKPTLLIVVGVMFMRKLRYV